MGAYKAKIPHWPEQERPRERLLNNGAEALSEAELLAIILRTGTGDTTCIDLARFLLKKFGGLRGLDKQPARVLCEIKGIGEAKASQLKASLELAKRLVSQSGTVNDTISCADDVYKLFHLRMRDLIREEFRVLFLSSRNEPIFEKTLFEGSLSMSVVSPREIILHAVQNSAASVILLHNHPSGHPDPSEQDKMITQKIINACKHVDIQVLDHIIIGKDSFFSFADSGLISL